MYRTVSNNFEEGEKLDYDMIIFFSPLGIQSLFTNFPDFKQEDMAIGCFGTSTARTVEEMGLRLDCEAPQPDFLQWRLHWRLFSGKSQKSSLKPQVSSSTSFG